jgi:hypothetical protein
MEHTRRRRGMETSMSIEVPIFPHEVVEGHTMVTHNPNMFVAPVQPTSETVTVPFSREEWDAMPEHEQRSQIEFARLSSNSNPPPKG